MSLVACAVRLLTFWFCRTGDAFVGVDRIQLGVARSTFASEYAPRTCDKHHNTNIPPGLFICLTRNEAVWCSFSSFRCQLSYSLIRCIYVRSAIFSPIKHYDRTSYPIIYQFDRTLGTIGLPNVRCPTVIMTPDMVWNYKNTCTF